MSLSCCRTGGCGTMQRSPGRNRLLLPSWMSARTAVSTLWLENAWLRGEVAEARRGERDALEALHDYRAAVAARREAESALVDLYRRRELARIQRDPAQRLH